MERANVYYFIQVARSGSFTRAGKTLNMPKSTLSRKVRELEEEMGVSLIQRTTRSFVLTEQGQYFYQNAVRITNEMIELQKQVKQQQTEIRGPIRLGATPEMGASVLPELIKKFLKLYPDVQFDLVLSNQETNLIEEGLDLTLRASVRLKDSNLIVKRLRQDAFHLYASDDYLKRASPLTHPRDLAQHKIIHFTHLRAEKWALHNKEKEHEKYEFKFRKSLGANSIAAIVELTKVGLGISLLPELAVLHEFKEKTKNFQKVLPAWASSTGALYLLYPSQKFIPQRVRCFIDFIIQNI